VEELTRAKEAEWRAKGYAPELISHALVMARKWSEGMEGLSNLHSTGLEAAERWIAAMAK